MTLRPRYEWDLGTAFLFLLYTLHQASEGVKHVAFEVSNTCACLIGEADKKQLTETWTVVMVQGLRQAYGLGRNLEG